MARVREAHYLGIVMRLNVERLEQRETPAIFMVTEVTDTGMPGEFRDAINQANAMGGDDTIIFNIPIGTAPIIRPVTPLPQITGNQGSLQIFGINQTTGTRVELDGSGIVSAGDGLDLTGNGHLVRDLVIRNFPDAGILLDTARNTTIAGNFIGTDATGTVAEGNGVGIFLIGTGTDDGSESNQIGTVNLADRNLISGNIGGGIQFDQFSQNNTVENNFIGTDASGTNPLGNTDAGIKILNGASFNLIGGSDVASGNVLAFNTQGVLLGGDPIDPVGGNSILGNSIFGNNGIGIDLGNDGITPNMAPGGMGPNNFQAYPILTSVDAATGQITGFLNSDLGTDFRIEFFVNPADVTSRRQAGTFLGAITVSSDNSGQATIDANFGALPVGSVVTATATHLATGDTSEISAGPPATVVNISGSPQSTEVNTGFANPLVVEIRDFFGDVLIDSVGGVPVTFTAPATGASAEFITGLPTLNVTTGADGQAVSSALTANTIAGSYSVIAATPGGTPSSTFDLTNVASAAVALEITDTPTTVVSGTPISFTVNARDAFGNIATTYTGTVAFSSTDATATLPGPGVFQPSDMGTRNFNATLNTFGDQTITVTDLFSGGFTATSLPITVTDMNVAPTANDATFTLAENSSAGTVVGQVTATDPNVGANGTVSFAITAGNAAGAFTIDAATGIITVANSTPLDFETTPTFTLTVTVTDGGVPPLSDTATVTINLTEVNEAPTVTDTTFMVNEDAANGTVVGQVIATDPDAGANGTLSFAITAGNAAGAFAIDPTTGVITVADATQLDFATTPTFTLTVTVSDGSDPPLSDTATITVTVVDGNEPPVAVNDTATVRANANPTLINVRVNDSDPNPGTNLIITQATQPTNGNVAIVVNGTAVTYAPNPGFFGTDTFTYTISDGLGGTATATVTVTVTQAPASSLTNILMISGEDDGGIKVFTANAAGQLSQTISVEIPFPSLFDPFEAQSGSATAANSTPSRAGNGDLDGDGSIDFVFAEGPSTESKVRVITNAGVDITFRPFEISYTGGLFVSVGDIDQDGRAEIVITPDEGGGGRVSIFRLGVNNQIQRVTDYFGIDDQNFRGGARTALGDVNGDGFLDLLVAAGFGGGPRIAIYDGRTVQSADPAKLVGDFFAFEQALRNGVYVASGDVNGDGFAELILGAGPGGGPRVLILNGQTVLANPSQAVGSPLVNFFAGNIAQRGGVRVAVKNLDGDGLADLIVGSGDRITLPTLVDTNGDGILEVPSLSSLPPVEVVTYLGSGLLSANGIEPPRAQSLSPIIGLGINGVFLG